MIYMLYDVVHHVHWGSSSPLVSFQRGGVRLRPILERDAVVLEGWSWVTALCGVVEL